MGSDRSPLDLYQAVLSLADAMKGEEKAPNSQFVVFATHDFEGQLQKHELMTLHFVPEAILMEEDPLVAIRKKRHSSLVVGIEALRENKIDAFVTAGNTGALVACATLTLKKKPGVTRPALMATLPTKKGSVAVIDVGGNLSCTAEQLVSFAHLAKEHIHLNHPKVGLLNIGSEPIKGTTTHKQAFQLLSEEKEAWDFIGNVEGMEVFQGAVDILVTDGFTGNIFLKSAEGLAAMIIDQLPKEHPLLTRMHRDNAPCAFLLGLDGKIVKCHGSCSPSVFAHAVQLVLFRLRQ